MYRVFHIEMYETKWLLGVEGAMILLNFGAYELKEVCTFEFHQPVFKKVTWAGLHSLRQKWYQISVKNWIFDDPFHKRAWFW